MITGLIASVLKLGFTGLVAADLGIHIATFSNEGAGIYTEIPDRRRALAQIQDDFKRLNDQFKSDVKSLEESSIQVNDSIIANNQLYTDLGDFFNSLQLAKSRIDKLNVVETNFQNLTPHDKNVLDYILKASITGYSAFELVSFTRSLSRGTTSVDKIVNHMNDIRSWNHLPPEQRKMLSGKKFGTKYPRMVSGYRLMKSALKFSGAAALSIGSIVYQVNLEEEELEALNAAIGGVQRYMQVLKGEVEPQASDFADAIPPEDNDYIYNFSRLQEHKTNLAEFEAIDFNGFLEVITFFRNIFLQPDSKLQHWKDGITTEETAQKAESLYEGLYNLVYFPKGILDLSDLECFTQNNWKFQLDSEFNPEFYPYQKTDMQCVQGKLHDFFSNASVSLLKLLVATAPTEPSSNELTEKNRSDIISVCKNKIYKNLTSDALREFIRRTKFVTKDQINKVVQEDLNGQCPFPM